MQRSTEPRENRGAHTALHVHGSRVRPLSYDFTRHHDGDNNNYSSNYGVEGPTRRRSITKLRIRQAKNFAASLLLSQGVPMILSGDEVLRTQRGNNNAYCQDNATTWFDWRLLERNAELLRFFKGLVTFRLHQPNVRRASFLTGTASGPHGLPDVSWYGATGEPVDWQATYHSLVCLFGTSGIDDPAAREVMILMHAGQSPQTFSIPSPAGQLRWRLLLDTEAESPNDIYPEADGPLLKTGSVVTLDHHAMRCFVAE